MRALLLTLLLGCSKTEPPAEVVVAKPAEAKPQKSRKDLLAETILAAIASDNFDKLRPLFAIDGVPAAETDELADVNADNVKQLRGKLDDLEIDLAKATLVRVESTGTGVEMFDVFVEANGRVYRTHFSAMARRGDYKLLGIANWIVPEVTKN